MILSSCSLWLKKAASSFMHQNSAATAKTDRHPHSTTSYSTQHLPLPHNLPHNKNLQTNFYTTLTGCG